jgi:hypothetical protein
MISTYTRGSFFLNFNYQQILLTLILHNKNSEYFLYEYFAMKIIIISFIYSVILCFLRIFNF